MKTGFHYTPQELMAVIMAREIKNKETICVGTLSPIPAAGAWLARENHAPDIRLAILGSWEWPFNDGTAEFFDLIQRGNCDLFFLSGAQIDKRANINLHTVGSYDSPRVRLPGGAGSAMVYYMARRTILFRMEHSSRSLVEKVDFITAAGSNNPEPGILRRGWPSLLVTPLAVFQYDVGVGELILKNIHPGVRYEDVKQKTGWLLDTVEIAPTPPPTKEELTCLRTVVKDNMFKLYPDFTAQYIGLP